MFGSFKGQKINYNAQRVFSFFFSSCTSHALPLVVGVGRGDVTAAVVKYKLPVTTSGASLPPVQVNMVGTQQNTKPHNPSQSSLSVCPSSGFKHQSAHKRHKDLKKMDFAAL